MSNRNSMQRKVRIMPDLGFQGRRLSQARKVRSLTQKSLAQKIERTSQAVSQYESGASYPSDETARRIAAVLDIPLGLLYKPWIDHENEKPVFYRSFSSATKRARDAAEAKLEWIDDCVAYFEKTLDLPVFSVPEIDAPSNPLLITDDMIEDAAKAVREFWALGDGPVENVIGSLEKHGVFVFMMSLGADTLDALSVSWNKYHPYIIISTDQGSACRWRFDAAHELGHLVLHRNLEKEDLPLSPEIKKLVENQAHRFASAFLLPERSFLDSVHSLTLDGLKSIKMYWRVSISAMARRAKDLDLLDDSDYSRLYIGISRRKWRREEPFDTELAPEKPALAKKCFSVIESSFDLSEDDFRKNLELPGNFIDDILAGYLSARTIRHQQSRGQMLNFETLSKNKLDSRSL